MGTDYQYPRGPRTGDKRMSFGGTKVNADKEASPVAT